MTIDESRLTPEVMLNSAHSEVLTEACHLCKVGSGAQKCMSGISSLQICMINLSFPIESNYALHRTVTLKRIQQVALIHLMVHVYSM